MEAGTAAAPVRAETRPGLMRLGRKVLHHSLNVYAGLVLVYLMLPITIILLFSFNDTTSRFNFIWQGFTLKHWQDPFAFKDLTDALITSIQVALLSTLIATALGTLMALALVRTSSAAGRRSTSSSSCLWPPRGRPGRLAAVAVHLGRIRPRLHVDPDRSRHVQRLVRRRHGQIPPHRLRPLLEEAAQDLGANSLQTFLRVTLPLIMPGVVAGALLAFALSIDDFVITNFNAGSTVTYPLYIWGAARVSIPPQVNVLAAMIFLFTVAVMLLTVWQQRRAEQLASVRPEPEAA